MSGNYHLVTNYLHLLGLLVRGEDVETPNPSKSIILVGTVGKSGPQHLMSGGPE